VEMALDHITPHQTFQFRSALMRTLWLLRGCHQRGLA
jgi:hypothetical protein